MDWDDAYANGAHIKGADSYPPRWLRAAVDFQTAFEGRTDEVAYGPGPRKRMHVFRPAGSVQGLAVFVHGGYWMKFDHTYWSHLAAGALARGMVVAMPGYTLCPEVRIAAITREVGAAITHVAALVGGPVWLAGHSAGGHLVSRMICQTTPLAPNLTDRIAHVLSISGVHDLRPVMRTRLNETLKIDSREAASESPALLAPIEGSWLTAWVGADERPEFVRQNALLSNIWTGLGARTQIVEERGRHHFDVIDGLAVADSPMVEAWLKTN